MLLPLILLACEPEPKADDSSLTETDVVLEDTECEPSTFWADNDTDGFGAGEPVVACTTPEGHVENDEDCDDTRDDVYPGATEICDEVDGDCDGDADTDLLQTFYSDGDRDGYGNPDSSTTACDLPPDHSEQAGDCDDENEFVNPGADEICDDLDNDCNDVVDDGAAVGQGETCSVETCADVGEGTAFVELDGTVRELLCDADGYALVANFAWDGTTGGVAGWNSGDQVGTGFTDTATSFKLSDHDINLVAETVLRARGTATVCQTGACAVDTTLYFSSSCTYDSANTSSGACAVAYTDEALTSSTGHATPCGWHYGLTSSACQSNAGMGTSHSGDHVFVGESDSFVHAYDGRSGEDPSLQIWAR